MNSWIAHVPRRGRCWRPGDWLFAIHPFFTLRPRLDTLDGFGWSVWWLWFEVSRATD